MAIDLVIFAHATLGQVAINPAHVRQIHPDSQLTTVITLDNGVVVEVESDFQSVFILMTSDRSGASGRRGSTAPHPAVQ